MARAGRRMGKPDGSVEVVDVRRQLGEIDAAVVEIALAHVPSIGCAAAHSLPT